LKLGANFLITAAATVDGHPLTLYGCLMGLPTLDAAFTEAAVLIGTIQDALKVRKVDVPLVTAGSLDPPGLMWRLLRINF